MGSTLIISDVEFEQEVLNSPKPVLAYFWDEWCGPCRLVSPTIDWIAENYSDRLKVVKLQVDQSPESVKTYKVEGVPGIRIFKNKEVIVSYEGAITKTKLTEMIDSSL